jgi:hypothetical protein
VMRYNLTERPDQAFVSMILSLIEANSSILLISTT